MMWVLLIVGIAFAGLFAHDRIQTGRLDSAKAETKAVRADLTVAKGANAEQAETIRRQNKGLDDIAKESARRAREAKAAQAEAAAANAKVKAREDELAAQKPQFPGDACKSACASLRQPL